MTGLADVTTHTISVVVDSANYSGSVNDVTYTFQITVQHCVVSVMTIPAISNQAYIINSGANTLNFSAATWSSLACNYAVTHTATYVLNAAPIAEPGWLTFSEASRSFSINTTSQLDAGVYTITVTASIPQPSEASGVKTVSTSFDLNVTTNDCNLTSFIPRVIPNVSNKVG